MHELGARALELLGPFPGGNGAAIDALFPAKPEPGAIPRFRRQWEECVAKLGPPRRFELIGSFAGFARVTCFRAEFQGGSAEFSALWDADGEKFAGVERLDDGHPLQMVLFPCRDGSFSARRVAGQAGIKVRLVERDGEGARAIVWQDATPGEAGTIVCRRLP